MEQNKIDEMIRRFLSGRFSSATEERVQKWMIKEQNSAEKEKASEQYWNELEPTVDPGTYTTLQRVNTRIGYSGQHPVAISLYRRIPRVAAILIPLFIIFSVGYLYDNPNKNKLIEISVAYGEAQHLLLPDSSQLWLNAGTTIRYPEKFKGKYRKVFLDGEAYFSVTKDENKPFIVETGKLSVKVLGTEFNVKAYSGEDRTTTTLASGQVQVNVNAEISTVLKSNEQLIYNNATSAIYIAEVAPGEVSGWLTGQLMFSASSFDEIIRTLERRFNVSIENHTTIPVSKVYTIKFVKDESLDEMLHIIEDVAGVTSKKEENRIILTNN